MAESPVSRKPTVSLSMSSDSVPRDRKDGSGLSCLPSPGPHRKATHGSHGEPGEAKDFLQTRWGTSRCLERKAPAGRMPPTPALSAWRWVGELCALGTGHASLVGWAQDTTGRQATWQRVAALDRITCRADDWQGRRRPSWARTAQTALLDPLDTPCGKNTHICSHALQK